MFSSSCVPDTSHKILERMNGQTIDRTRPHLAFAYSNTRRDCVSVSHEVGGFLACMRFGRGACAVMLACLLLAGSRLG
jgi:hypothetical protein